MQLSILIVCTAVFLSVAASDAERQIPEPEPVVIEGVPDISSPDPSNFVVSNEGDGTYTIRGELTILVPATAAETAVSGSTAEWVDPKYNVGDIVEHAADGRRGIVINVVGTARGHTFGWEYDVQFGHAPVVVHSRSEQSPATWYDIRIVTTHHSEVRLYTTLRVQEDSLRPYNTDADTGSQPAVIRKPAAKKQRCRPRPVRNFLHRLQRRRRG